MAAKKTAAKKTTAAKRTEAPSPAPVRHKTSVTKSGDVSTASCSCGWSLEADAKTAGSAAAVHAGKSRRTRNE